MKALQIAEQGCIKVISLPEPDMGDDEVLLRIDYVGFCGSDLNTYRGRNAMAKPQVIPGHEVSATVVKTGNNVPAAVLPGMRVTVNPYTGCGHCKACLNERSNACEHNETMGVQRDGAMREYIAVPWGKIIQAPGLSPKSIALIEPMSVGFHAVNRAAVTDTDIVWVIGCGMVGMGAIVRASLRGATVIASDIDDRKLELAHRVGAAYTINTLKENIHDRLMELTSNLGPDVVIEAVGNSMTQQQAIENVSFTGRVTLIGYAPGTTELLTKLFVQKELDIRGSRNAKPADFRAVIHYMQTSDFPASEFISSVETPETAADAMERWNQAPGKVFRILVQFLQF
ncbi:MAG: zinc-binding alcohol dehydrogenase family protein [Bacteroidaceae bacterium]|nr:zinc-binding alcohol dehydrogenase family protein [Bacteroidaceae bacterium]